MDKKQLLEIFGKLFTERKRNIPDTAKVDPSTAYVAGYNDALMDSYNTLQKEMSNDKL